MPAITDPTLLGQLDAPDPNAPPAPAPAQAAGPVTDPTLLQQLNAAPDDPTPTPPATPGQSSGWGDVARGIGSGLVKGAAAVPGFLGDMTHAGEYGVAWATAHGADALGLLPPGKTASDFINAATTDPVLNGGSSGALDSLGRVTSVPTTGSIVGGIENVAGQPLPQPTTKAGQAAENVTSFLPQAATGGTMRSVLLHGLVPGAVSEGSGQVADDVLGPQAGAAVRVAGAIAGSGAGSLIGRPAPAEALISGATRGVSDADMAAAQDLTNRAAAQGISLTPAEAIGQVTGGRGNLGSVVRNLEGMRESAPIMSGFFSQRPGQVQNAGQAFFDQVAPPTAQPSMIGTNAQAEAEGAISGVQGGINQATRPFYAAAEAHQIPDAQFAPIGNDPAFQASLGRLRGDPVLGPRYANLPDNSIGVVDAVTKDMYARQTAHQNAVNPGFNPELGAAYGAGANAARSIARNPALGGSADYDTALQAQAAGRQMALGPVQAGPVGQIAGTADTMAQTDALYPSKPLAGSEAETAQAVQMLPTMAPALTRQYLQNTFNEATQNNLDGPNQWGGAKWAAQVAGNGQQATNLRTGLMALPNGPQLVPQYDDLTAALMATGQRQRPGSQTTFNTEFNEAMEHGTPIGTVASLALSPVKAAEYAREWYQEQRIGSNAEMLAHMLTNPQGLDQIAAARAAVPPDRYRALLIQELARGSALPASVASNNSSGQ